MEGLDSFKRRIDSSISRVYEGGVVLLPFLDDSEIGVVEAQTKYLNDIHVSFDGGIIDADRKPYHGRIIYSDNNVFEIEKTEEKDISGIYGSEFKSKDSYNGIDAEKYTFENTEYVIWQKDGFSYSYSSEKGLALSELMSLIK